MMMNKKTDSNNDDRNNKGDEKITDKQMKKMMFGTDSIFRETGTTSEVIENIRHSEMYRLELRRSISDK